MMLLIPSKSRATAPVIVLTGGGSGGHIAPILSLAPELKALAPKAKLVYIGQKNESLAGMSDKFKVFEESYRVAAGKFRRYHGDSFIKHLTDWRSLLQNIFDGFRLLLGIWQSWRLLGRLHPAVVFSKGGYVAVPVGLAARWRRIPLVTHDSDAVAGLANRLIAKGARFHATGFPVKHYSYPSAKSHYVGIPIDHGIKRVDKKLKIQYRQQLGLPAEAHVLLLGGGGHGSMTLNKLLVASAGKMLERDEHLHILHLCGAKHLDNTKLAYDKQLKPELRARIHLKAFTEDFEAYSGAADLIVSRAGASSLAVYAAQAKACLIIPAPWLAGGHQLGNTEALVETGAVAVANNNISPEAFEDQVAMLMADEKYRNNLAANLHNSFRLDANQKLAELILEAGHLKSTANV